MSKTKDWPVSKQASVALLITFALMMVMLIVILFLSNHFANLPTEKGNPQCEYFASWPAEKVPAGCINYFRNK